jgi:integrase
MTVPVLTYRESGPGLRVDLNRLIASRALVQANSVHAAAIEAWALPYIRRQLTLRQSQDAQPDDLLFPGLSRSGLSHHHVTAAKRVGVVDYTLKDSRHSIGVRMRKAGRTFEEIGAQLGTSTQQVVNVYAVYKVDAPTAAENQA